MNKILLLGFFIFLFAGLVFAPETVSNTQSSEGVASVDEPVQSVAIEEKPYMNNYGSDFGYGMPFSLADPKYVAQQKFIESMTSVYTWVSLNSKDFIVKCDGNKEDLVKEVINVINDAEEKSDVCKKFESEVKECSPESFCKNFQKGKLHLPPEVKFTLKKMGKDLDKLEIKDLTEDLLFDVCKTQLEIGVKSKSSYYDKTKDSIKAQLPAFRSKCEEFKKWQEGMGPQIKLPDFYIPKMEQPKNEEWKQQEYKKEYKEPKEYKESQKDYVDQPPSVIEEPGQQEDGQEKIEEPQEQEQDEQQNEQEEQNEQEQEDSSSEESSQESSSESSESSESTAETAPTFSIKMPMGLAILPSANAEEVKQEIKQPSFENKQYTAICGNNLCEPDFGENPENCHDDCTPNDFYKSSEKGYIGPSKEPQGIGPQGMGPQGSMGGPGLSPEMMCELTDDELVEMFTPSDMGMSDEDMKYNCKKQSSNMWSEMSMLKLENAKCLANASLDCASKEKLVENCNTAKSNPENVAKFVVNNLCRQFGVKPIEHDLYKLADKWLSIDPALAYELGDTVDTTIDDEKNLGTFSYVFGDGEYSDKMKEKADKLKAIKQRIEERGIEDPETVKVLEEQEKEFNNEANKFGNFFNFSRFFG